MAKIALSLSGGGFRAMLFHLGVVRYLRMKGLLEHVTTISAVSGGAIIGAHLAHNWEAYTRGDDSLVVAGRKLVDFAKKDVRGRILRRIPGAKLYSLLSRIRTTRGSLLRRQLRRFYGQDAEFLTQSSNDSISIPKLFVVSTNLTTTGISSFSQDGFYQEDPNKGEWNGMKTDGLKTAEAVGTSAAFPAFFPPHKVTASDFGVDPAEFGYAQQFLTDGGVYDNLGVRQLHILKEHGTKIDLTIVSDGGATVEVDPGKRYLGLVTTAFRAADILLQRVRRLEYEILGSEDPGKGNSNGGDTGSPSIIIRSTDNAHKDRALPPRIQLALRKLRTDLDAFTDSEIKWLIRQGYYVAQHAVEASAATIAELGIGTNQVGQFDPSESFCRAKGLAVTDKQTDDDWMHLQDGAHRKYRIFAWNDWASWANIVACLAIFVMFVSSILYYRGFITDDRFFDKAYAERYSVRVTYDDDIVERWYDGLKVADQEVVRKFVEKKLPIPAKVDGENAILERLRKWNNAQGNVGTGRAFLSRLGTEVAGNREQEEAQRKDPSTTWVGILFYWFPPKQFDWTVAADWINEAKSRIAVLLGIETFTIIHFRGRLGKAGGGTLCLNFLQSPVPGIPRRVYDMKFDELTGKPALKGVVRWAEDVTIFANCEPEGEKAFRVGNLRLEQL